MIGVTKSMAIVAAHHLTNGQTRRKEVEKMNVLIACEESQAVCKAFRALGHEAYSCDIQECSGGHPEWHIKGDCLPLLNGNCEFVTMDGEKHFIDGKWDLLIAHPPCTYISNAGVRFLYPRFYQALKRGWTIENYLKKEAHNRGNLHT